MVKRATWKEPPTSTAKQPRFTDFTPYQKLKPSWRVGNMLLVHDDLGWHAIDGQALQNLQQRLRGYECRTWQEILHDKIHSPDHLMAVNKLSKVAQTELRRSGVGDIDEIVSLRIGRRCRAWGVMQENGTLLLLWWDPKHLVYKMNVTDN